MQLSDFGDCCTSGIIEEWGGRVEGAFDNYAEYKAAKTLELKEIVEELNENESERGGLGDVRNRGILFATVTSAQVYAVKFAKEVGFRVTRPANKGRHADTKLIGMFIDGEVLHDWYENN